MNVLLITADLMTSSKVSGTCAAVGVTLSTAADVASAERASSGTRFDLAILDLATRGLDVGAAVVRLRAIDCPPARIIAFGPHVHEQLLQAARDAGCDAVYARGEFYARLGTILAQ